MSSPALPYYDLSLENLSYGDPVPNKTNGKNVGVTTVPGSTDYKHRIRFQMSKDQNSGLQKAIYGVSNPIPGATDDKRRSLDLSIEDEELSGFLKKLDEKNISTACSKSMEWFKKEFDRSMIENMYVPLYKPSSNPEKYKPTVRTKLKISEQYNTEIWVATSNIGEEPLNYKRGTMNDITKGSMCLAIVETGGLWFASRQFGMSLALTQILVYPSQRNEGISAFSLAPGTQIKQEEEEEQHTSHMDTADF